MQRRQTQGRGGLACQLQVKGSSHLTENLHVHRGACDASQVGEGRHRPGDHRKENSRKEGAGDSAGEGTMVPLVVDAGA